MKLTPALLTSAVAPPHEPDAALVRACSVEQLRDLGDMIENSIAYGNAAIQQIHQLCGKEATGIAGELLRRFNTGVGHMREADAILGQLWRAKAKHEREGK